MTAVYTPRLTTVARTVTIQFSASEYVRQCHDSVIQSHTHPTHAGPHYRACRRPPTYFTHDESSIVLYHTRGRRRPVQALPPPVVSFMAPAKGVCRRRGGGDGHAFPPPKKAHNYAKKSNRVLYFPHLG